MAVSVDRGLLKRLVLYLGVLSLVLVVCNDGNLGGDDTGGDTDTDTGGPVTFTGLSQEACTEFDLGLTFAAGTPDQVADADSQTGGCPPAAAVVINGVDASFHSFFSDARVEVRSPGSLSQNVQWIADCAYNFFGPPGGFLSSPVDCDAAMLGSVRIGSFPPDQARLVIIARQVAVGDGASAPHTAEASIDCGGVVTPIQLGEEAVFVDVPPGTTICTPQVSIFGSNDALGQTVHRITLVIAPDSDFCNNKLECPGDMPFCSGICHDGSETSPCGNDEECADGHYCSPFFECRDGSQDDPCDFDGDCQAGLACVNGFCSP